MRVDLRGFICFLMLLVLGMPADARNMKDHGDELKCLKNLRDIGIAILGYCSDNNDRYPASFKELFDKGYLKDKSVLISPFAADRTQPSYELLYPGADSSKFEVPSELVVARCKYKVRDTKMRTVLYADIHVSTIRDQDE